MRKYIRERFRREAEQKGLSPSRFVNIAWDKYQENEVGRWRREVNKAKGSRKRRNWYTHIDNIPAVYKKNKKYKKNKE